MKPFAFKLGERIRTADRITLLIIVVSVLLLSVASYGAWHVNRLQEQSERLLSQNVNSIQTAVELELHIQELRHLVDVYLWRQGLNDLEEGELIGSRSFAKERAEVERWLQRAEASVHSNEESRLLRRVQRGLDEFYAQMEQIAESAVPESEKFLLAERAEAILESEVLSPARQYLSADEVLLEENRRRVALQSDRLAKLLLFLGLFGSIASLITGYGIARAIHRSLLQVRIPMQDVAGKLREVVGDVIVSANLDLDDVGPTLEQLSQDVAEVVQQLHDRHREMVRADQLAGIGQLAAGLAHEIRNPLMAMKMIVQTATRDEAAKLDRRDLSILDDEIRRLEELLTEFLEVARPTPLKQAIVDARSVVESTVDFVQKHADARRVALHCRMPDEPVMLQIDAPRIRQVLLNLLLNAIQAAPPGGNVGVDIETTGEGDWRICRLKVSDDGPGIGPRQAMRIFEPFYSTKDTGLGLGLAVSQRICRSHGGELALERGNYSGAILVVELPFPDERHAMDTPSDAGGRRAASMRPE